MRIFRNMKISLKLAFGFTSILLFMGIVGWSGVYSVNNIQGHLDNIFARRLPSIDYLIEADRDLQQLLVAERSMIFANAKSDIFKALVEEYEKNLQQASDRWEKYKTLASTDEEKALIPAYEAARKEWMEISRRVVDGRKADTRKGRRLALDLTLGQAKDKFEAMRDYLDQLTEINLKQSKADHQEATDTYENAQTTIFTVSGLGLVTGILLMIFIGRGVTRPLQQVVNGLVDISQGEGDLTQRLDATAKDEVGILSSAFNDFIEKLQAMIREISASIDNLSGSAQGLMTVSKEMAVSSGSASEKSSTVASSAEEMSANMISISTAMEASSTNTHSVASAAEEMNSTVDEIARNAEQARGISDEAVTKVGESTRQMDLLGQAAQAIGQVVETITDISEQVNLLSLNATIEAARAGEAGKGFAVVANEIKDLANQTSIASMDIKEKIENIQGSSSQTLASINEINQVISSVDEIVSSIATAVEEQSAVTREISTNINQASTGIQEVNENVNQSAVVAEEITREIMDVSGAAGEMSSRSDDVRASAKDLSGIADQLNRMVGRFKY